MHVGDGSIETYTVCNELLPIITGQKPQSVCFCKVRVQLLEGLSSQLCMGMMRDSKSKCITVRAYARASNFLNSVLLAIDAGFSIAAASKITKLL